jgi:hypothetical protein
VTIKEILLSALIRTREFRKKYYLIRLTQTLMPSDPYLKSAYGIYLKENMLDLAWRLALYGYKDRAVHDKIRKLIQIFVY